MSYNWPSIDFDYKSYELDIKQDIETYIDWDVDTDINVDIDKDVDVKVDVDIDVKDQGSLITAVVKDVADNASGATIIGDAQAVEDAFSTGSLTVLTENVVAQLDAGAFDKSATALDPKGYLDSGTFTEINLGVDNVKGEFTVITLDMQALVDG